ncbi:MAG TPA: hypothetical protein VK827_05045, partial [Lysobacter sp.]|nr:hypothetical protein [Lysobacter sp.]
PAQRSAENPTSGAKSPSAKTAQPVSPMDFELPEPAEGCSCSCEEFTKIQEISEKVKSASQADLMALMSDPDFQALSNCMSACAMQYMNCQ